MPRRVRRWIRAGAVTVAACLALSACTTVVDGTPSIGNAPNAQLKVVGDSDDSFDTQVKNALTDIMDFWKINYPKISGGKSLPPIRGGFYSVDGLAVAQDGKATGDALNNKCIAKSASFIVDNGAYCPYDDSIAWDRAPTHLFAQLAKKYGSFVVALIFAHEFGHAIQDRLGILDRDDVPTIDTESQADCASGAWAASALKHQDPHFRTATAADLDRALEGYLDGRDSTPDSPADLSHGNGFDRLSALADGLQNGVTYCYSSTYFDRKFTERPYVTDNDKAQNGNEPLAQVLNDGPATSGGGGLQPDLNKFWEAAAKSIGKTFTPVKVAEAAHPKCGASSTSQFGYCPDDNTVYYDADYAKKAYNSLPGVDGDQDTGNVTLLDNQPADFTLGTLFVVGWGLAVRHQLFNRSTDDKAAIVAASCYSGAYAKSVNVTTPTTTGFALSPPDLDEATSAMLSLVGSPQAYGARGTSGLDRIQAFVKGYNGGLHVC